MADFEGRNPEDCDFHGIKQLLRQLFLKANVDLGGLAQIIICKCLINYGTWNKIVKRFFFFCS